MKYIQRKDIEKLTNDPIGFAIMMDDGQLEHVIATFVAILNKRKINGGGKNC